jgi:hypothetical protein
VFSLRYELNSYRSLRRNSVFKGLRTCVIGSWIHELCLDCCRWYFGKIKRIEAEKKLLLPENDHGAFLIRDSESRRNDYSLSGKRASYRRQNYFP